MKNRFALILAVTSVLVAVPALAQTDAPDNPECLGSQCGKPKEQGGGGCGCGCGCSVWVAYTDDGKTLAYTDDADGDGKSDDVDNCPFASNRDQADSDGDQVGNACDSCADAANFTQLDSDGDGQGDVCDGDMDGDTVANAADNCPLISNAGQPNVDGDAQGNACDSDDDGDGVADGQDNCPLKSNADQVPPADLNGCNVDADNDNVGDSFDNCASLANPDQKDTDADGQGDACDLDLDNDSVKNDVDNCPTVANRGQLDDDGDKLGDACDTHYCVVVDPAKPDDCLDPKSPFTVSGGGTMSLKKNEKVRPPLFANRNGAAVEYTWTVLKRPAGSKAAMENPKGAVTMSRHWEYAYVDGSVPSFTADVDGIYELQLAAKLAFADRVYPDQLTSTSSLALTVGEGETPATCAAFPADASLAGLGFALMALLRRRRA